MLSLCCLGVSFIRAQESMPLTLESALAYAYEHHPGLKNARTDIEIARKKVKETTAIGLPQVNASLGYNHFPNVPTQLLPDFLSPVVYGVLYEEGLVNEIPGGVSDRLFEAQFGTPHTMTAQATVSQLVFNGPYIVGLQAARAFVDFSVVQEKRNKKEVEEAVKNAYYQLLIAAHSLSLLDSTRQSLESMLQETKEIYRQGFLDETDVDQLELLLSDLDATQANARNQYDLAERLLRFQMGMPAGTAITLTTRIEDILQTIDQMMFSGKAFKVEEHIDMAVIRNQRLLNELDMKRYKSLYLPSLSAFYNYQQVAQRTEFDFTDAKGDWFPTEVIGIQVDIPLWSSGSRSAQVQQARLQLDKTEVLTTQVKDGLELEAANARSNLENAWKVFGNKQKSMGIAEKIYTRTGIRYREGMASSLELQQTYTQYLQAEGDYILAALQLFTAKSAFEKAFQNNE